MKKNIFIFLFLCVFCVIVLYVFKRSSENTKKNGFNRNFKICALKVQHIKELNSSINFVGQADRSIAVYSFSDKFNIFKLTEDLSKIDTIKLKFPTGFDTEKYKIRKDISNERLYCLNVAGDIAVFDKNRTEYYKINDLQIDRAQVVSPNTIIARAAKDHVGQKKRELAKLSISKQLHIESRYSFPAKSGDSFANDGVLHYDKENKRILYMFYYTGEYLCLDTNLNLLYRNKTIDTVSTAVLNVKKVLSKAENGQAVTKITPASPPKFVNIYITTKGKNVYILSKLKADNENQDDFNKKQVIDVYNIDDGGYLYSFHVPRYYDQKLRKFIVKDKMIVGLLGKFIVSYEFLEPS